MSELRAILGLRSISARFTKYSIRIHGTTVTRFAGLLALKNPALTRHVTNLITNTSLYLQSGSFAAGSLAWKSIKALEEVINKLPPKERINLLLELQRYRTMLLARDPDLAKILLDYRADLLAQMMRRDLVKSEALIARWQKRISRGNKNIIDIFEHYSNVVAPYDSPGVQKAAAYVQDNIAEILSAVEAAKSGYKEILIGHLVRVRGDLGEGYALYTKIWLKEHLTMLDQAKILAKRMGKEYEVVSLTQLENKIKLDKKEAADQMILIINKKKNQAITFLSAQAKTANVSDAVKQTLNDYIRELNPKAKLTFFHDGIDYALTPIQHKDVAAHRYILNAAGSRIPKSDLEILQQTGIEIKEFVHDMSISQFSLLALNMIEEGLSMFT